MTVNINLLPWREELKEQQKREFLSLLCLGVLIAGGLIFCIHFYIGRQIDFQTENNDYLKSEIKKLDQQIAQIQALQKEKEQLLARMEIIQQLQSNRSEVVKLFDGIVHTVPDGLYLTSLSRNDSHILIDGKAESNTRVSTFMRNIESSHWMRSPVLTYIQADDQKANPKNNEMSTERMIEFHLQALQAGDEQANLNKLLKEDNATSDKSPPK